MNPLLALKYIREITIAALTIAVIALIGLYGQSRADIEHLKTEHALQLTTAKAAYEVQARKLEQQQYDQTITAINDHKKREAANASAIVSANTANERLSQTIDRLAANAETDAAYRAQYAATTGQLLKECSGSITALAKAADGHVNDIRLLQDAR
ncbi:hypothetical protein [Psychrobacter aquimaris]|uniref:hypothetical protein n=1 Tax=Psychrobacter aquimaris TaxID=292733 RepID=UPI0018DF7FBF|nr:hypothetical protein [Psychrobacter aquimaris]